MILSNSRTLLEDIIIAKKNGYTEEFIFRVNRILGRNNNLTYLNSDCTLIEYCLHEGLSDPSDQSILFLIECSDGTKGCLSSSYGTYANADLISFVNDLNKIESE